MALPRYVPHYTISDYELWEGEWELWSGVPIAMSPSPSRRHQTVAGNLYFSLRQAVSNAGCRACQVLYEIDWRVSEDTVLRPDLLIVCDHAPSTWIEKTPRLVAEILSHSTRRRDTLYKREMYEELGVAHYLIVDPEEERVQLLSREGTKFVDSPGRSLDLTGDCRIVLEPDDLFHGR